MGGRETKTIRVGEDLHTDLYYLKEPDDSFDDFLRTLVEFYKWKHPGLSGEPPADVEAAGSAGQNEKKE